MSIYVSTLSAVVSALASDCIDNTSKQAWQKLYRPGYQDGFDLATLARSRAGDLTRMDVDCWVYARLHSQLKPRHWNALVAKYSTHKGKKVQAISALCPIIASPAPRLFITKAVTAWAIPPLKGVTGKRSSDMIVLGSEFYDVSNWDSQGLNRTTYWRWKSNIEAVLNDMISGAMGETEEILRAEGVLLFEAA
jgi:hypothetical protein